MLIVPTLMLIVPTLGRYGKLLSSSCYIDRMYVTLFLFVLTAGNENEPTYLKALSENVFQYPLPQVRYCKTVMYRAGESLFRIFTLLASAIQFLMELHKH